jgi:hypothetical protein
MSQQEQDLLATRLPDNTNKVLFNMDIIILPYIILIHKMINVDLTILTILFILLSLIDKLLVRMIYRYASRSTLFIQLKE